MIALWRFFGGLGPPYPQTRRGTPGATRTHFFFVNPQSHTLVGGYKCVTHNNEQQGHLLCEQLHSSFGHKWFNVDHSIYSKQNVNSVWEKDNFLWFKEILVFEKKGDFLRLKNPKQSQKAELLSLVSYHDMCIYFNTNKFPKMVWQMHSKIHNESSSSPHIYQPQIEGDNVLGSVRPSVCALNVMGQGHGQICGTQWSILGARLCRVQQRAKKSHYQSKVFVCVLNNRADGVDRLLIVFW